MRFRNVIFWLHLAAGLVAGLVILVMSVTGVILTYELQINEWANRGYWSAPASGAARLGVAELLAKVPPSDGEAPATAVGLRSDPAAPATVSFGRTRTVYVNPYTGQVLGEGSERFRPFLRSVVEWHRYLALSGERRPTGKAITGACNLAFLFLVVSGFYLWWPKKWRWSSFRTVLLFRTRLRGKARDWNWHNVIGFWSALPLFVVVISATIISYPWANKLVYRVMGEDLPPPGTPLVSPSARPPSAPMSPVVGSHPLDGIDAALDRAREQMPDWRTIGVQLPKSFAAPVVFALDRGTGRQPQHKATFAVDRVTGETRWEPFAGQTPGRRLRTIMRFAHTGEVGGIAGQTVAGLATAGAVVLFYTGLALSFRRFFRRGSRGMEERDSLA